MISARYSLETNLTAPSRDIINNFTDHNGVFGILIHDINVCAGTLSP